MPKYDDIPYEERIRLERMSPDEHLKEYLKIKHRPLPGVERIAPLDKSLYRRRIIDQNGRPQYALPPNPETELFEEPPRASAEVLRRRAKYLEEGKERFREAGSPSHFGQAFGGTWRDPDPPPVYWSRESGQHVVDEHGHPRTLTEDESYGLGLGGNASLGRSAALGGMWTGLRTDYFDRHNADAYTRMRVPEWMQRDLAALRFEAVKKQGARGDSAYRDITPHPRRPVGTRGDRYVNEWFRLEKRPADEKALRSDPLDMQEQLLREQDPEAYRRYMAEKHGKE